MQKSLLLLWFLLSVFLALAQTNPEETAKIRQQMAKIRQTTDWNNPTAAAKANEEIKRLAALLSGGNPPINLGEKPKLNVAQQSFGTDISSVNRQNIVAIADRFYKRSYPKLDAISKSEFDQDFKAAEKKGFNLESIRELTSKGGAFILFGTDHHRACVYTAAAVRAFPTDTLSVNNFGAYLRMIDSSATSIPVLLYANSLFSQSPIILTQLGNSYFELNDFIKAELYYKEAVKADPGFGQAHSALCDLYISQNRLKEALVELFAGVKNMGCSYMQASSNMAQILQKSENSDDGFESKEEFWGETRKQMEPDLAPLVPPERVRIDIPKFPNCERVEDWLEGGGWSSAVQSFTGFHSYHMSFASDFLEVHKQLPALPPGAILRDYPNERFALDCITEMFAEFSRKDYEDYSEKVDKIVQTVNDAKELYIQNLERETKIFIGCTESCGGDAYCLEDCHRKFCKDECPNANKFNELLRKSYKEWFTEFKKFELSQKKLLDDLYGFTNPWLNKIESPYWSKIYAYEVRSTALGIAGSCYAAYAQPFQWLSHNDCGTDCSVYANPYPLKVDEVNKKPPEGNQCPGIKLKISLPVCDIGLDCESIEVGCIAGVAGAVKYNFRKKTTTGFLGVGVKGEAGVAGASVRAGVEVTVNDDLTVEDVGARVDISVKAGAGPAQSGISSSGTCTVMTGCKTSASGSFGPKIK